MSKLLCNDALIPSELPQCQLLIKHLYEQLWNARKICDEQKAYMKYLNVMDVGNRIQISFILNELKQHHLNIYHELYHKLQANEQWTKWKNLRANDAKIKQLRENLHKIKQNEQALHDKNEAYLKEMSDLQEQCIYNLRNQQSAASQRYNLSLRNSYKYQGNQAQTQEAKHTEQPQQHRQEEEEKGKEAAKEKETEKEKENNTFFTKYEKKMRFKSEFDLCKALSSVDSINAPTHKAPKPDIVDLTPKEESKTHADDEKHDSKVEQTDTRQNTNKETQEVRVDVDVNVNVNEPPEQQQQQQQQQQHEHEHAQPEEQEDEKWIVLVKKLLNEFSTSMDLTEINEKLETRRYCSEFDVLNDMLCINKTNDLKAIKVRFCFYFGNLSDWSWKRLIKWCQTNKFYQICQKIRSKKINGSQFIDIVNNIQSVKRFFSNLTTPQVIQLYNRINHYFSDPLSIF
mmetsp:Transcript_33828/g.54141  ORF Transcript_33828/g.54141 Transcript_33828/m.54141 type:complete len:457 (-) Transcript_33828:794-2164(-)